MSYQLPSLEELKELAAALKKDYRGDNSDRKNFITLINRLVQDPALLASENAGKILLGAYIFEMEHIKNTYYLRSPENSALYSQIKAGLKITKSNDMTSAREIIGLSAFYNYIKYSAPEQIAQDTTWMKKIALQKPVLDVIKSVLGNLKNEIHCIVTTQPFYTRLQENLKDMQGQYAKTAQKGWLYNTGTAHIPHAKFIDLINEYCDKFFPHVEEDTLEPALQVMESYMLRMGAAVFVMRALEAECRFSKPGSKLYSICGSALNITQTTDFDLDDRIDWLKLLDRNIKNMLENRKEFVTEKEKGNYNNIRTELTRIQGMIAQFVSEYYVEKNAPSRIEGSAILATSIVAQNRIQSVLSNTMGIPTPGAALIDTAAGATGSVLGPIGSLGAVAVSRFIRSYVIPFAVAGICASALDTAGNSVGSVAVKPFSLTARGIKSLVKWCRSVEMDKSALRKDEELLEALVSLPDDAFSAVSKAKIEKTTGVKPRMTM